MKTTIKVLSLSAVVLLIFAIGSKVVYHANKTVNEAPVEPVRGYETFELNFSDVENLKDKAVGYTIDYKEKPFSMTITLQDVRYWDASQAIAKIKTSPLVEQAYTIVTLDDSALRLGITFKSPVVYQAKALKSPSALIIDVAKDEAYQETGSNYQVHTEAMAAGEGLAMAEEMLMSKFSDMRVLPFEQEGQFYLELGQYPTEVEAQQAVKTAEALGLTVAYRKVN